MKNTKKNFSKQEGKMKSERKRFFKPKTILMGSHMLNLTQKHRKSVSAYGTEHRKPQRHQSAAASPHSCQDASFGSARDKHSFVGLLKMQICC
jgi:hypothetical protein